mgnify:CR=1 FL=1
MNALLQVNQVNKHFGGLHVLKNFSMQLNKGEIVGILGPNGAGKTTLFNLLTGFIPIDTGEVLLHSQPIHHLKAHKIVALGMARTFQLCRPFAGLTVLENVLVGSLGPRVHSPDLGERAMHLLSQVGLIDKAQQACELLSYGDLRRLEIARALATQPEILLLDEPTASLDACRTEIFYEIIHELTQKGNIILLSTHDLSYVKKCQRLLLLKNGKLLSDGKPQQLLNAEIISAIWGFSSNLV